jgi:DNA-binding transcriptional regulator YiaG
MNGIKHIRAQLGLSQTEFAQRTGMSQGNVSNYEVRDQAVPPRVAQRVIQLAKEMGFECSFDDVYSESPTLKPIEQAA